MISTEPIAVSWDELDRLVGVLADKVGNDYDLVLAITRGGLVPAGILAYRLDLREILVAGVEFYTTGGKTHDAPRFGHFPDVELLRDKRILVVDEVWETGPQCRSRPRLGDLPVQGRRLTNPAVGVGAQCRRCRLASRPAAHRWRARSPGLRRAEAVPATHPRPEAGGSPRRAPVARGSAAEGAPGCRRPASPWPFSPSSASHSW
jgi:hypothetical protein